MSDNDVSPVGEIAVVLDTVEGEGCVLILFTERVDDDYRPMGGVGMSPERALALSDSIRAAAKLAKAEPASKFVVKMAVSSCYMTDHKED